MKSPGENDQGSWIVMTFDDKGRMIASDQYGALNRLIIPSIGADTTKEKIKVEKLEIRIPGKWEGVPQDVLDHYNLTDV